MTSFNTCIVIQISQQIAHVQELASFFTGMSYKLIETTSKED